MGSFSKRQKIPTNVVTQNTKEAIMEFSLPQLTFLIKILQSITEEDLNSDNIFIDLVDRYINEIGSFMQNQTDINLFKDTQQKIKTVKWSNKFPKNFPHGFENKKSNFFEVFFEIGTILGNLHKLFNFNYIKITLARVYIEL